MIDLAITSLHYMIAPKTELIYGINYSTGTTVYQGDNRFSLKNIQYINKNYQHINKLHKI